MGKRCIADCPYCEYKDNSCTVVFDHKRFDRVIAEIVSQVKLLKVVITGGEPALYLQDCLKIAYTVKQYSPNTVVKLNTNGYLFSVLSNKGYSLEEADFEELLPNVTYLSVSRHSTEDNQNKIFLGGYDGATNEILQSLSDSFKCNIHLTCNLIKGGIDTIEKVKQYMNTYGNIGFVNIGFVGLMQINSYCKTHGINIRDLETANYEDLLWGALREYMYKGSLACQCKTIRYFTDQDILVDAYFRQVMEVSCEEAALVYMDNHLKTTFSSEKFIY